MIFSFDVCARVVNYYYYYYYYFYSTFLFVPGIAFIDVVFPVAF